MRLEEFGRDRGRPVGRAAERRTEEVDGPHVLVAVRRIAAEWDTDGRQELLHPALRSGDGTGERASARLLPPPGRRLLSRAFQRVPETSRALLWHTEVEAEPLAVPAALLGLDEEDARVELRRARERLREECLQVHRELAPEEDCQRYLRMLDVTFRRGGTDIDPDLRQHLAGCSHCARTADQLARFNDGLPLALAEAVLGWGASGYLESRTADPDQPAAPAPTAATLAPAGADTAAPPAGEAFIPAEPAAPRAGTSRRAAHGGTSPAHGEGAAGTEPVASDGGTTRGRRAARGVSPARRRKGAASVGPGDGAGSAVPGGSAGGGWAGRGASLARRRKGTASVGPGDGAGSAVPGGTAGRGAAPRRLAGAVAAVAPSGGGAEPAVGSRRFALRAARRARRRNLALAVVTVGGLVVLPLALWSALGSDGGPAPGTAGTPSRTPGGDAASPGPSWAGRNAAGQGALEGRLRNLASGLCVGVVGDKAVQGAETELAACSAAPAQQWRYETDGLLRSAAAPDLCLDSRLGYSVRLAPCTATGKAARALRYDFTLQGVLVPRSDQELALTPAATDGSGALVVKTRAAGTAQRWAIDTAHPDLRMENVHWDGVGTPEQAPRP